MKLENKIIVITGGSRGFGKTLAQLFIEEGAKVVICSQDKKEVKNTAKELGCFGLSADVTIEKEMTKLLNKTVKKLGKVDIWINNAGLWLPLSYVEDFDLTKARKMFEVNVFGVINGTRVALRYMKNKNEGTIINVISDSALLGRPMSSLYCSSKWAVNGFTKSIRGENKNIKVLAIYPGAMKTEIFGKNKPKNFNDLMDTKYVAEKVIKNLKLENPKDELVIKKSVT